MKTGKTYFAKALVLGVLLVFIILLTAPEGQAGAVRLRMGGGPLGTAIHSMCAAWAEVMNKQLKDKVEISVQVTPGTRQNPIMVRDGQLDLAGAASSGDLPAWKGEDLAKGNPCRNIRLMFAYSQTTYVSFSPESTGIKAFDDFAGKKIGLGSKGSPTSKTSEDFFAVNNVKARFFYMSPNEMIERLKDGLLDGSMYGVSHPWAPLLDLGSVAKVRFFTYPDKYIENFLEKNPIYVAASMPANMYANQPQAIKTFGSIMGIDAAASVPDELVYLLVKTTWAQVDEIKRAAPYANALTYENTMSYITPLHPGALKYYQEKGLKIPPKLFPSK